MIQKLKKTHELANVFKSRKEVNSWYSAYKIGWMVSKAPEGINERSHEVPWILNEAERILEKGKLLDVGSYLTSLPDTLTQIGFQVTALDLRIPDLKMSPNINFIAGDIRNTSILDKSFDQVTCISTIEHIGIKGRYGVITADKDGDIKAMNEICRLLKTRGTLLLTIPVGSCNVLPANRCYDGKRLNLIFRKFAIEKEEYFVHEKNNLWKKVSRKQAQMVNWYTSDWYALGCFKLVKFE